MKAPAAALVWMLIVSLTGCAASRRAPSTAGADAQQLVAVRTDSSPLIDGRVEEGWQMAPAMEVTLHEANGESETPLQIELRALHTDETLYLLARWSDDPPLGDKAMTMNKLTVHWRIAENESRSRQLDCSVVCHTHYVGGEGQVAYANAETIPPGGAQALPVAGGWQGGQWILEWSRPLLSENPYDLQFSDMNQAYVFFLKLFEHREGQPDRLSEAQRMVFQP